MGAAKQRVLVAEGGEATLRRWIISVALLVLAAGSCGEPENSDDADSAPYEDPRTMTEMCEKWCANAEVNGCPDISGSDCMSSCVFVPLNLMGDCVRLYKNHVGCLADVPNVCDGDLRYESCHNAYCNMRRECELPDENCD
jgi:hypothetical protein